ncbi:MAG TPA: hypothetical protein VFX15_02330, partial [Actinomycetes bacterium]|nr:hypothetical protein [Actinomycetes bacterium]
MSTPTLERRPTHKAFPLLRSEISRISHRRLFRVLSILFLLGILLVSGIAFLAHHEAPEASGDELTQVYEKSLQRWERCVDQLPSDLTAEEYCGPEPTIDTVDPYVFREDT